MDAVSPDNIKSINVLKGEQAIKKYPEDGKNGVAEITSRKGETKPSSLINPTFYLDGVKITVKEMKAISPNDIESINILKGENAIKKYPEDGKTGVVEIKLKHKN